MGIRSSNLKGGGCYGHFSPPASTALPVSADENRGDHVHFTDGLIEGSFCSFLPLGGGVHPRGPSKVPDTPPLYSMIPWDPYGLHSPSGLGGRLLVWATSRVGNAECRAESKGLGRIQRRGIKKQERRDKFGTGRFPSTSREQI